MKKTLIAFVIVFSALLACAGTLWGLRLAGSDWAMLMQILRLIAVVVGLIVLCITLSALVVVGFRWIKESL